MLFYYQLFNFQRIMSWLRPEVEERPTLKDSPCQECQDLKDLAKELQQNFSLLAETGYAEGVMCHTLIKGGRSDKQNVSIAVPLLVRTRKVNKQLYFRKNVNKQWLFSSSWSTYS